jgi:hypothetical protein
MFALAWWFIGFVRRQIQASGRVLSSCRLPEAFSDSRPVAARAIRLYLLYQAVDKRLHITDENTFEIHFAAVISAQALTVIDRQWLPKAFCLTWLVPPSVHTMRLCMRRPPCVTRLSLNFGIHAHGGRNAAEQWITKLQLRLVGISKFGLQ